MDFLNGAFSKRREATTPVARDDLPAFDYIVAPPSSPTASPVAGSGDDVSSTGTARAAAFGLLVFGGLIAWWLPESRPAFMPRQGFALFAGFFVGAQAIERALELLPAGTGSKQAKANRAVIFPALGFLIAVLVAEWLGLYYIRAIGAAPVSSTLDVIVTALAIGGGTKPLHDGIKNLEKSKETPPATT